MWRASLEHGVLANLPECTSPLKPRDCAGPTGQPRTRSARCLPGSFAGYCHIASLSATTELMEEINTSIASRYPLREPNRWISLRGFVEMVVSNEVSF